MGINVEENIFIHNTIHIKKFHFIQKPPQYSYFMINKGLKKSAKNRMKLTITLEFEFFDWKMNIK